MQGIGHAPEVGAGGGHDDPVDLELGAVHCDDEVDELLGGQELLVSAHRRHGHAIANEVDHLGRPLIRRGEASRTRALASRDGRRDAHVVGGSDGSHDACPYRAVLLCLRSSRPWQAWCEVGSRLDLLSNKHARSSLLQAAPSYLRLGPVPLHGQAVCPSPTALLAWVGTSCSPLRKF